LKCFELNDYVIFAPSVSHPAKAVKGWVFVFFFVSIRIFRIREFSEFEILGILKFGEF